MLIEKNLKEAFADYIRGKFEYRRWSKMIGTVR